MNGKNENKQLLYNRERMQLYGFVVSSKGLAHFKPPNGNFVTSSNR